MNFLNTLFARIAAYLPASVVARIGGDKALHFAAGLVIGLIGSILALIFGGAAWWSVAFAALFGLAKEVADYLRNQRAIKAGLPAPHGVEFLDFVWTAVGGLIPSALFVIFAKLSTGVPALDPMLQMVG